MKTILNILLLLFVNLLAIYILNRAREPIGWGEMPRHWQERVIDRWFGFPGDV